ncbi:hypothetical protein KZX46_18070 [Polymorphobacter sp. PAMC 29334]|nr:hypothetical protein KZX46_18070 [Polymorphobacter sp. PAMC 29334]
MTQQSLTTQPHFLSVPQRAEASLRLGRGVQLRARVETTPAGLLAIGGLVAAILLSTARIVEAARRPRQLPRG